MLLRGVRHDSLAMTEQEAAADHSDRRDASVAEMKRLSLRSANSVEVSMLRLGQLSDALQVNLNALRKAKNALDALHKAKP
jgi:hypothetical protein